MGKLVGNGPRLWLQMQAGYDEWEATTRLARQLKHIPSPPSHGLESASILGNRGLHEDDLSVPDHWRASNPLPSPGLERGCRSGYYLEASVSPESPRPWIRELYEASGGWQFLFQHPQFDPYTTFFERVTYHQSLWA